MNEMQRRRRTSIIINFLSIFCILFVFYLVKFAIIHPMWLVLEILPLSSVVISFRKAFVLSGAWKICHSSFSDLDERELQLVLKATNLSYSIFTICTLIIIYIFILSGLGCLDAVLAGALLYFAHIIPTSIIAWVEKE